MNLEQQISYFDKKYKVLSAEQEYIVHPAAFGLLPISKASLQSSFSCEFHIEDYRLILDRIKLPKEEAGIPGVVRKEDNSRQYEFHDCTVSYNGAVLIGADMIREYYINGNKMACFSYQKVLELVFEDGILITTVDQSKSMLRIRKNIELGFRSLNNCRDIRCISRFMNSSFIGDYRGFLLNHNRMKYVKDMKNDYRFVNYIK